jgi:hypothetical protein
MTGTRRRTKPRPLYRQLLVDVRCLHVMSVVSPLFPVVTQPQRSIDEMINLREERRLPSAASIIVRYGG